MKELKYIITGTGRCGTGYFSKLLNDNNIVCGHESIFGPNRSTLNIIDFYKDKINKNNKYDADSSWLVAPYIDDIFNDNMKIINLVRNPIKVIKSMYDIGDISRRNLNSPYVKHILNRLGIKKIDNDLDFLFEFYIKWNNIINNIQNNDFITIKLEDLLNNDHKILDNFIGKKLKYNNNKINTKKGEKSLI